MLHWKPLRCPPPLIDNGRMGRTRSQGTDQAMRHAIVAAFAAVATALSSAGHAQSPDASDWGYYGGDAFGEHFSSLDEINRQNVSHLQVAWTYRTGELGSGFARAGNLSFEATPVL